MLRSVGLNTAAKFVAMVVNGELVVKLPAERVDGLVPDGTGRHFASGGRVMKEWVRLKPAEQAACAGYVGEARSFVQPGQSDSGKRQGGRTHAKTAARACGEAGSLPAIGGCGLDPSSLG